MAALVEVDLAPLLGLLAAGLVAGFINTVAGGGSVLTLPALMLFGLPADVANGTNRVGVLLQSLTAARTFDRAGKLDRRHLGWLLMPTLVGAGLGALAAAAVPREVLEPILLGCMIVVAVLLVARPAILSPMGGEIPRDPREHPRAFLGLLLSGFYGGFLQAGVGFMLIAALCGVLRYDLVHGNAVKVVQVAALTLVALVVFAVAGLVSWIPGLVVATSMMLGGYLAARFAIERGAAPLRWIVLIAVVVFTIVLAIR